jgi:hypothetical protein
VTGVFGSWQPARAVVAEKICKRGGDALQRLSIAHFERFVQPFVKVVPCGQLLLIEPGSLDHWVQEHARLASAVA